MNNFKSRDKEDQAEYGLKDYIDQGRMNYITSGYNTNSLSMKNLLHGTDPQSTLFISERERFDKEHAILDRKDREFENSKRNQKIEKHRTDILDREIKRWEDIQDEERKVALRQKLHIEKYGVGKRNLNSLAYNPITFDYEQNQKGDVLKVKHDKEKIRGILRASNIDLRSNCGYNILTGETKKTVEVPEDLRERYSEYVQDGLEARGIPQFRKQYTIILIVFAFCILFLLIY